VSNRFGEIDLVAIEQGPPKRIVFVEVKTRIDQSGDHPADRVDEDKQRRLTRAALAYLKQHRLMEVPCRFDVIAVWWPKLGLLPHRIDHFENAFEATGCSSLFS
jgi:putative endonuclease